MWSEKEIYEDMCRDTSGVSFEQVCGYSDVKKCLSGSIQTSPGADSIQKPLLLYGHPGVGKTLLLVAAAAEAKVKLLVYNLYSIGSHYYPKAFAHSLKIVFNIAHKNRPCILTFEDLHLLWSENDEVSGLKEEFLSQLQQFQDLEKHVCDENNSVTVVAVSTTPWLFDSEVLRMFQLIHIDLPQKETRGDSIGFHLRDIGHKLTDGDLHELSEKTEGFTGSDICCLVKDAAMQEVCMIANAKFFKKVLVPTQKNKTEEDLQETNSNESRAPSDTAADAVTVASLSLEMPSVSSGSAACNSGTERKGSDQDSCLIERFVPCLETDEGAVQMSLWDIDPNMIYSSESQVTFERMNAALANMKPSVSTQEIARMVNFAKIIGSQMM